MLTFTLTPNLTLWISRPIIFLKVEKISVILLIIYKNFREVIFVVLKQSAFKFGPFCKIWVICKKNLLIYRNEIDHTMICIGYTFINMETRVQCALKQK